MLPLARRENLSVRELAEETLIYDTKQHKLHCLNSTAAWIWRHCDGKTSVDELARLLHLELSLPQSEEVVRLALDQLARRHLLAEALPPLTEMARLSRRDALKKFVIAGLALPIVMTAVARTAKASTTAILSKLCPAGFTPCGITPFGNGFGRLCCDDRTETCDQATGKCVAKQPASAVKPKGCGMNGDACTGTGQGSCCAGLLCNGGRCAPLT